MSGLQPFALADLPAEPWKNGGGRTRTVATWPAGAGLSDFDARVSVATIAASGPFSRFPGIDRQIVLLSGGGVRLSGPGIDHHLDTPLAPFAFAGEAEVAATVLGGPSEDFNVMVRRGRWRARVEVLRTARHWPGGAGGVLLAWRGDWTVLGDAADAAPVRLTPGEGVWWQNGGQALACAPAGDAGALLAVAFDSV